MLPRSTNVGQTEFRGHRMIARLLLSTLAAAALSGCMTNGYDYRGGQGDYYYGQPTIEYRHYGYGAPYDSYGYGFGYSSYGHGYPYGYYGYPYGYYPYGYYDRYYGAPNPLPPAQPPDPSQPADGSSLEAWVREHGSGQVRAPASTHHRPESNADASAARQLMQARQPQPPVRMATPSPVQSGVRAPMPRPSLSSPQMSPPRSAPAPRSYPSRPAAQRSSGGDGNDATNALLRKRNP